MLFSDLPISKIGKKTMFFFVRRPFCSLHHRQHIVQFLFLVLLWMAAGPNGFADAAPDMASLKMLNKLHFNLSKNVMGKESLACCSPVCSCTNQDIEISDYLFLYGLDQVDRPNMDIQFHENDWTCTFRVYPDWAYKLERKEMVDSVRHCLVCTDEGGWICFTRPFCSYSNHSFNNQPQMVRGSGIYNRPSMTPNCIYDFHKIATEMYEYDLLRYCAKGYFFQGRDYTDPKRLEYRKDWILYLTNGALICGISDRVETNRMLLANGYKVQLVQRDPRGNHERCKPWTNVTATASSYEDKREDGQFLLAGIIGSMLVDKKGVKSGADESLWSEKRMKAALPIERKKEELGIFWTPPPMTRQWIRDNLWTIPDDFVGYYKYENCMRDAENAGRYRLELHIEHFCTPRGMRAHLAFDVSTGPDQVPNGIYEDPGVKIYLDQGRMVRTTGQELGMSNITCTADGACKDLK